MKDVNGKTIYLRTTEEKILTAWINKQTRKISIRDTVKVGTIHSYEDSIFYRLWNTNLVEKIGDDVYIYIASNQEEADRYYNGWYGRRDYIISNTTKSRLNAFLCYYGFNYLEVHSSMKDWSVKYNGELLDVDSWYKLDFTSHKLVKVEK